MRKFNRSAQIYIWSVIGLGPVVLLCAWYLQGGFGDRTNVVLTVAGCLLVALLSWPKFILVSREKKNDSAGKAVMSLGYVPTFLVLFGLGPLAGALAGLSNVVTTPRRASLRAKLFNASSLLLSAFLASLAARPFGLSPGGWDPFTLAETGPTVYVFLPLVGMFSAASVYYIANTALVTGVLTLSNRQNPLTVWRGQLMATAPAYFAGASFAALILAFLPYITHHASLWVAVTAVMVVSAPIPAVISYSYKFQSQLHRANQERIETLRQTAEELERKNAELQRGRDELQQLYTSTVESLALAIDAKDRYTKEHIQRVKEFAVAIAIELGMEGDDLRAIETGALLHDIGKLAVPEHILTKPGRLSDEEFAKIKAHPEMGARILEPVHFPFPVMPIVRHHHERWDGKGYPDGLAGEDIPLGGRILAVADVYDALTSDRSYRKGWTHERAIAHLKEHAGSHFDPRIVDAFFAVMVRNPHLCVGVTDESSTFGTAHAGTISPHASVAAGINRASFEYLALYEIAQVAAATLSLSETVSLLAERVRNIFNASTCVILLRDEAEGPTDDRLRVGHADGEQEHIFALRSTMVGQGETGLVAQQRKGLLTTYRPADLGMENAEEEETFRSVVIAPLMAEGKTLGTINLYHKRPHAFDQEDLRVLEAVATQAGPAVQNAMEYDRTLESALTDALTGLYNARHLERFLDRELERARAQEQPLTVLVLDLDNFKPVNDCYGHAQGNEVLRDLGSQFQTVVRSDDLVARYAGDEFVIVLPGSDAHDAHHIVERVRSLVQGYDPRPVGTEPVQLEMGVSIGMAVFPQDGAEPHVLINAADRAMFRDKRERKGLPLDDLATATHSPTLRLVA